MFSVVCACFVYRVTWAVPWERFPPLYLGPAVQLHWVFVFVLFFVCRARDTATFVWEPQGRAGEWPATEMLSQFPKPPPRLRAVRHCSHSAHLHWDADPADCLLSSAAWWEQQYFIVHVYMHIPYRLCPVVNFLMPEIPYMSPFLKYMHG